MENEKYFAIRQKIEGLSQEAKSLGATSAVLISSDEIQSKDGLAALCNGEFTCPNHGLAASCPPHVAGPIKFRKWQAQSQYSIAIKIELPTSVMFSDERKGVMQLLHHIVAAVEQKAIKAGFTFSKGFAGGSCKELFCEDQEKCCVVEENKPCRHTESARPSMSGFGVDVTSLMESAGWSAVIAEKTDLSDDDTTSWVAGLVMIA